jgi:CBS domain containing-hemolysin-like protein
LDFVRLTSGIWWSLAAICKPIVRLLGSHSTIPKKQFDATDRYADEKKTTTVEKDMLTGIAAFGKLTVRQVMRNRPEISAIDSSNCNAMGYYDKCGFRGFPSTETPWIPEGILH